MEVIVPKPPEERFEFGLSKFVRFSRLKASLRNSSLKRSVKENSLCRPKFSTSTRGPRTMLRPALPKGWLRSVGIETLAALSQLFSVREAAGVTGSPMILGR